MKQFTHFDSPNEVTVGAIFKHHDYENHSFLVEALSDCSNLNCTDRSKCILHQRMHFRYLSSPHKGRPSDSLCLDPSTIRTIFSFYTKE